MSLMQLSNNKERQVWAWKGSKFPSLYFSLWDLPTSNCSQSPLAALSSFATSVSHFYPAHSFLTVRFFPRNGIPPPPSFYCALLPPVSIIYTFSLIHFNENCSLSMGKCFSRLLIRCPWLMCINVFLWPSCMLYMTREQILSFGFLKAINLSMWQRDKVDPSPSAYHHFVQPGFPLELGA